MNYTPLIKKPVILNSLINIPDSMMEFLHRNRMIKEIHEGKITVSDAYNVLKSGGNINQML